MAVSFDAFAPGIDRLIQDLAPGTPCAFNADDEVGYLVTLMENGRPVPAGQLHAIETKHVNEATKILTVTEEVGRNVKRRHGRDALDSVIASRSYSYPVWWNDRQGKWCPAKGVKIAKAKEDAIWRTPEGEVIEIWCHLVLVESMTRFGFRKPEKYIGKRRKQGTRTEGRENRTTVTPPVLSSALAQVTAPVLVNPPEREVFRKVDLGESNPAPPTNSLDDVAHIVERFRRLDLD